jgi:hypothetical protein
VRAGNIVLGKCEELTALFSVELHRDSSLANVVVIVFHMINEMGDGTAEVFLCGGVLCLGKLHEEAHEFSSDSLQQLLSEA